MEIDKIKNVKYKNGTLIQHIKRGTIYEITGTAYIESTLTPAYIYRCLNTDITWVRPISEIEETTRFSFLETMWITTNISGKVGLVVVDEDGTTPIGIVRYSNMEKSKIEIFDTKIITKIKNGTKQSYSVGCKGV